MGFIRKTFRGTVLVTTCGVTGGPIKLNSKKERISNATEAQLRLMQPAKAPLPIIKKGGDRITAKEIQVHNAAREVQRQAHNEVRPQTPLKGRYGRSRMNDL